MPIIIESHRIMGVDKREVPEGTILEARGYPASEFGESWSAVSHGGESLAVTVPGGRIEIYLADEWPCNDCGVMVPVGQELCNRCTERQAYEERREDAHPEWRCPPRE